MRRALAAVAPAVASYLLWTAAAADDTGAPGIWTVLSAAAFWLSVLALAVIAVRAVRRR